MDIFLEREDLKWLKLVADPIRLHILRSLVEMSNATAADLAASAGASGLTTRRHLEALVAVGLVNQVAGVSDGQTPGRPAARFSLQPAVRKQVDRLFGSAL
jgi:predicted ArsR family transcriptional regulator